MAVPVDSRESEMIAAIIKFVEEYPQFDFDALYGMLCHFEDWQTQLSLLRWQSTQNNDAPVERPGAKIDEARCAQDTTKSTDWPNSVSEIIVEECNLTVRRTSSLSGSEIVVLAEVKKEHTSTPLISPQLPPDCIVYESLSAGSAERVKHNEVSSVPEVLLVEEPKKSNFTVASKPSTQNPDPTVDALSEPILSSQEHGSMPGKTRTEFYKSDEDMMPTTSAAMSNSEIAVPATMLGSERLDTASSKTEAKFSRNNMGSVPSTSAAQILSPENSVPETMLDAVTVGSEREFDRLPAMPAAQNADPVVNFVFGPMLSAQQLNYLLKTGEPKVGNQARVMLEEKPGTSAPRKIDSFFGKRASQRPSLANSKSATSRKNERGPNSSSDCCSSSCANSFIRSTWSSRKRECADDIEEPVIDNDQVHEVPYVSREEILRLTLSERKAFYMAYQVVATVDPSYVFSLIVDKHMKAPEALLEHLFTSKFPTVRQRSLAENAERRRNMYLGLDGSVLDPREFLKIYPDPESFFNNDQRKLSSAYTQHALAFLSRQFPRLRIAFVEFVLKSCSGILLRTFRLLVGRTEGLEKLSFSGRFRPLNEPAVFPPYPDDFDDVFFREAQFCLNETRIEEWKAAEKRRREEELEKAEKLGLLKECIICCNDQLIEEDFVTCGKQEHEFCIDCIKAHADAQIGEGATAVRCMSDVCKEGYYTLLALQKILPFTSFQLISRRKEQEELRSTYGGKIESCPFCAYAMVMEDFQDKIFRCQNPYCQKESCRECHEEAHIPLRCEEIEKDFETERRKFIEECMASAVIRKCPSCGNRIIKESGCNKMACPCGCYFCYHCNKKLSHQQPYNHFGQSPKCPLETPLEQLHAMAAKKAGTEALRKFNNKNPSGEIGKSPDIDMLAGTRPSKPPVAKKKGKRR